MELHKIQSLLDQVGIKIKHGEEIAREKGENFNIFKILNLETRENQTHSAFLKEMLDPKGSHEMGTVFLNHFLSQIKNRLPEQSQKIKILDRVNSSNCKVRTEHSIGQINLIEKTGGRLDLFIKDKDGLNMIENLVMTLGSRKHKIIFMSGAMQNEHALKAINLGVKCFLIKPFTRQGLLKAVIKALGKK